MQTPNENDAQAEPTAIYDDEDEQSPFQIYQGALEEASSKGFAIYRIIKLPTPAELSKRSRKWARDYLRWLDNQLSQLSRNSNYILINSPRAPKWGAAGARIILNESMFDITYKGGDTVQLRDRLIAKLQKERILSSAFMGEYSNIDVYCNDKLKAKNHFGPVNALSSEDFAAFVQSCRQEFDIKFT